jgi:hypothetical protein
VKLLVQAAGAQHEAGKTKETGSQVPADTGFPFQHPLEVRMCRFLQNDHLVPPDLFFH